MNGTQLYKVRSGPYEGDNSHTRVQNPQLYISSGVYNRVRKGGTPFSGCQNVGSLIQGDENAVAIGAAQAFPEFEE